MKKTSLFVFVCLFLFTFSFLSFENGSTVKAQSIVECEWYCEGMCLTYATAYADYLVPRWTLEWPQILEGSMDYCMSLDCWVSCMWNGYWNPPSIP